MTTTRISVLDLTVAQVEAIEREVGLPVNRWKEAPSLADLYARVRSAATGEPIEDCKAATMRDILATVSLSADGADPKKPGR